MAEVEFWFEYGYRGTKVSLPIGEYSASALHEHGIRGDSIRSMKVPEKIRVNAYNEGGFSGRYVPYHLGDYPSLKPYGQNAEIRSLIITEAPFAVAGELVTLYEHVDYNEGREGWFQTLPYNVEGWGYWDLVYNDSASSAKVPPNTTLIMFEDGDYNGRSVKLRGNSPNLGWENFNDKMSSLKVLKDEWIISSIDWDYDNAVTTPRDLVVQTSATTKNTSENPANSSVEVEFAIQEESSVSWSNSIMTGLTISVEKEGTFPLIGGAKATTSLTIENTFTKGGSETNSTSTSSKVTTSVEVPPKTEVKIEAVVVQQDVTIDYTATLKNKTDPDQVRYEKGEMKARVGLDASFTPRKLRDL